MARDDTAYDAVVVGAGPNGLVAANRLADAGWSVLLLEHQAEIGGAVRSDQEVHPDFVHDTFSAFYPLAAVSPTIRSLDLEEHGLTWSHAPVVLGIRLPTAGGRSSTATARSPRAGWTRHLVGMGNAGSTSAPCGTRSATK